MGKAAREVNVFRQFPELHNCQNWPAPYQSRRFAACPHCMSEKGNQAQDQLPQWVLHDAKTQGLMGEVTRTTEIWAMCCWPSLLALRAVQQVPHCTMESSTCRAAGASSSLPCFLSNLGFPLPHRTHTCLSMQRDITEQYRREIQGIENNSNVLKFLLIREGKGGTQTLFN